MATSKQKGLDEPMLEGGVGGAAGAGYRSPRGANEKRLQESIDKLSPKERAELNDPVKMFGTPSPIEQKAMEKVRNADLATPVSRRAGSVRQKATSAPDSVMEEARRNKALDQARRDAAFESAVTEGKVTKYPYVEPTSKKKGGVVSASKRADGIAARGKTRGRLV